MKNPDKKINVAYNRKSAEDKEKQVQSIEDQIEANEESAKNENEKINKHFKEVKSAKKPHNRPQFDELIEFIKKGKVKNVYVWRMNRLARNSLEAGMIEYYLQEGFIEGIVTPTKTYSPDDHALLSAVEFGQATQFSRDLSRDVKRGLHSKAKKGWSPNMAPVGYLNTPNIIKGKRKILVDHYNYPLVKKLWAYALTGNYSISELTDIANNKLQVKPKHRKSTKLNKAATHYILTNKFYCGYFNYGGKEYSGIHKHMITLDEFNHFQKILKDKGKPRHKKEKTYNGIFKCGECGYSIVPGTKITKFVKSENRVKSYQYFWCSKKNPNIRCTQKSISEKELEKQILDNFNRFEMNEKYIEWFAKFVRVYARNKIKNRRKDELKVKLQLDDVQDELDGLIQLMISKQNKDRSLLTENEFAEQKRKLKGEKKQLLKQLKSLSRTQDKDIDKIYNKMKFCENMERKFLEGNYEEKRKVLKMLGQTMTLKDKKISIEAKYPFFHFENVKNTVKDAKEGFELIKHYQYNEKPQELSLRTKMCRGSDLNRRHCDFQSHALPTELPRRMSPSTSTACPTKPWRSRKLLRQ